MTAQPRLTSSRYTREIHTHGADQTEGGTRSAMLARFPYGGGKGAAGVVQTIINEIPRHQTYIEAFVGGGAVFRAKTPAASSILIDRDPAIAGEWARRVGSATPSVTVLEGDSLELVPSLVASRPGCFVYLDPPYLHATRRDLSLYRCEMSDADHQRMLQLLASLPCKWALSGYRNAMYDEAAASSGWRRVDYRCMTRRGPVTESLWLNYSASADLAEFTYAGSNFRDRERIKRKVSRWVAKFKSLPAIEQRAIFSALVPSNE